MMKRGLVALLLAMSLAGFVAMPSASAQADDDPAAVEEGREIFANNCSGCHGSDGTGSATGRPLIGIASQEEDRSVHIASVTNGKGGMPPYDEKLSEEEIDAVISFVRLTFVEDAGDEAAADDAADDADDADDDAAAEEDAQPEALAETGVESYQLTTIGVALILAGAMFLTVTRRDEDVFFLDELEG